MSDHLTPLDVATCLIGTFPEIEKITGNRPKAAYGWLRSSKTRTAGEMPLHAIQSLMAYAKAKQIPLTADHLIWGAPWEEIAELVEGMGKTMPAHLRARRKQQMAAE